MSMSVGDKSPKRMELFLVAESLDFDTVTGVDLTIKKPSGATVSPPWDWQLSREGDGLLLTHTFAADGSDLDESGTWNATGDLLRPPDSPYPLPPFSFQVFQG